MHVENLEENNSALHRAMVAESDKSSEAQNVDTQAEGTLANTSDKPLRNQPSEAFLNKLADFAGESANEIKSNPEAHQKAIIEEHEANKGGHVTPNAFIDGE